MKVTQFSSGQLLSRVWLFATPWTAARQGSLSITNSRSPPKPMSIESVMPSNHLILCCPLLLLPSIFPSIRVFSNESVLRIRWPKYWSFSFNISPSNEHPGLISFRMDWLDLLAFQGTLKSLLQYHSSKASILWHSAFFTVQLSHPYMTTQSCPALCNPMDYSPWNFPGQNTGVDSLSLLQGIFPTQGSNPGLQHCRQILYQLSYKRSPRILEWVAHPFSRGSSWPRNQTRVSSTSGAFFFLPTELSGKPLNRKRLYKKNFGCLEYNHKHKHNNTSYNNVFRVKMTTLHSIQIMIFIINLKLREKITQFQYCGYKYPMLPRYLHM